MELVQLVSGVLSQKVAIPKHRCIRKKKRMRSKRRTCTTLRWQVTGTAVHCVWAFQGIGQSDAGDTPQPPNRPSQPPPPPHLPSLNPPLQCPPPGGGESRIKARRRPPRAHSISECPVGLTLTKLQHKIKTQGCPGRVLVCDPPQPPPPPGRVVPYLTNSNGEGLFCWIDMRGASVPCRPL